MRWGLVPYWAKDRAIGSRMINARAETVAEKPAFRRAFARRRCLLPADGFYEWQQVTGDGGKRKQPYYIYRADGGVLAFAGLYELWRDPAVPEDHPDSWLWTATIITTRAEDEVGQIHDRMPMVVDALRLAGLARSRPQRPGRPGAAAGSRGFQRADVAPGLDGREQRAEQRPRADRARAGRRAGLSPPNVPQARSGPSGAHPPDGAPASSGGTLF